MDTWMYVHLFIAICIVGVLVVWIVSSNFQEEGGERRSSEEPLLWSNGRWYRRTELLTYPLKEDQTEEERNAFHYGQGGYMSPSQFAKLSQADLAEISYWGSRSDLRQPRILTPEQWRRLCERENPK